MNDKLKINTHAIKDTLVNFLVPIICLAVTALLFFLVIFPSISSLPILEQEVNSKKMLETQLKEKLTNLNSLLDFKNVVDENSRLVSQVLVSEPLVPELLTQVDTIAREAGLDVTQLSYSFNEAPARAEAAEAAAAAPYESIIVTLSVQGSYAQFIDFFEKIENSSRLVDIVDFRYAVEDLDVGSTTLGMVVVFNSPYLFVESKAATDDAITVNITDDEFVKVIDKIKSLKYYDLKPSFTDVSAFEETPESTPSETPEEPEVAPPPTEDIPSETLEELTGQ